LNRATTAAAMPTLNEQENDNLKKEGRVIIIIRKLKQN
jgi:hypothetical protein